MARATTDWVTRFEKAREEHQHLCELIAEGEFLPHFRGHHEKRDRLWAEIQDLEIEHARELAEEAALEFVREWFGQIWADATVPELKYDLGTVTARIKELDELESNR